ncbi:MAG: acyltransferase family protein [Pseudomonadota bacterium]
MNYRAEIDGLRAVAVAPVILFHAGFSMFSGGFVGVDVFFVISGYLITALLIKDIEAGRFSLLRFYERRARRLLPALFVMLAVATAIAWVTLMPKDMADFSQSLLATSLFSSNILFWREAGYFDTASELKPLLHTWSLAVEEQFYILFPPVLYALWRWGRVPMLAVLGLGFLVSLALAQWGAYHKPSSAFFLLPTRAWELLLGSFCALYLHRRACPTGRLPGALAMLGLAGIVVAFFIYDTTTPFPSLYTLLPTGGAALVILCARPGTWAHAVLSLRGCVGLGLISYSAYLWHQPLFVFARYRHITPPSEAVMLLLCGVVLAVAYLSWRYVERPFRTSQRIGRPALFWFGGLGLAACATVGLIGDRTGGFPAPRIPADVATLAAYQHDDNPFRRDCFSGPNQYVAPDAACILGVADNVRGVLMGDSHSDAIAYPLHEALTARGLGVRHVWYNGCPPVQGLHVLTHGSDYECGRFNSDAFAMVYDDPTIEYVVLSGRFTMYFHGHGYDNGEGGVEHDGPYPAGLVQRGARPYPEAERQADVLRLYTQQVRDLLAAGKRVILLYPVPEQGWNVPLVLAKTRFFSGKEVDLSVSHASFRARNAQVIAAFDALPDHPGLFRVEPEAVFCDTFVPGRCVGSMDQKALYYDDDHLSNYGASYIVPEVVRHMAPAPARSAALSGEGVAVPAQPLLEDRPEERRFVHDISMETRPRFLR